MIKCSLQTNENSFHHQKHICNIILSLSFFPYTISLSLSLCRPSCEQKKIRANRWNSRLEWNRDKKYVSIIINIMKFDSLSLNKFEIQPVGFMCCDWYGCFVSRICSVPLRHWTNALSTTMRMNMAIRFSPSINEFQTNGSLFAHTHCSHIKHSM